MKDIGGANTVALSKNALFSAKKPIYISLF